MAEAIRKKTPLPHVLSHPRNPEPSRFPKVNCNKFLFINGKIKKYDKDLIDILVKRYNYNNKIGKEVLEDIKDYLQVKADTKIPSFCLNKDGKGMATKYLYEQMSIPDTRVLVCYNESSGNPFSIMVYNYDNENNCVYVRAFCSDQSVGDNNKGSGTLLLHDLINAVSDTKIDSIFLNSVSVAKDYYLKQGFQYTGEKDKEGLPEMTLSVDLLFPASPTSPKKSDTSIADMIIARSSSSERKKSSPKDKSVFIKVWDKEWHKRSSSKEGGKKYKSIRRKNKGTNKRKYLNKTKRKNIRKQTKKRKY
jgi:hypothetical protein